MSTLWAALLVSTLLFVCMSGRMIPGMAILTSAADPAQRGTFMALNAAVQSAGMGLASLLAGWIIGRNALGQVTHYWVAGLIGAAASLLTIAMARRLVMHGAVQASPHRP